jgi:hypothetical protein
MKAIRVQYTVQEKYIDQNKKNIKDVMDDLRANPITGLHYSSYYLGKGKFMHVNVQSSDEVGSEFSKREKFISFRTALKASAPSKAPKSKDLELVGSSAELV